MSLSFPTPGLGVISPLLSWSVFFPRRPESAIPLLSPSVSPGSLHEPTHITRAHMLPSGTPVLCVRAWSPSPFAPLRTLRDARDICALCRKFHQYRFLGRPSPALPFTRHHVSVYASSAVLGLHSSRGGLSVLVLSSNHAFQTLAIQSLARGLYSSPCNGPLDHVA